MSQNTRLYQTIASRIAALIEDGTFPHGERLPPERELVSRLDVSRPVLREALIALELAGMVDIRTGSGTYVRDRRRIPLGDNHFANQGPGSFELLRARQAVESGVAALAAANITANMLDRLDRTIADLRLEAEADEPTDEADRAFHLAVAEAAGNRLLAEMVGTLWDARDQAPIVRRLRHQVVRSVDRRMAIDDHGFILAALRRRDAEAARHAMWMHLENVTRSVIRAAEAAAETGGDAVDGANLWQAGAPMSPVAVLDTIARRD